MTAATGAAHAPQARRPSARFMRLARASACLALAGAAAQAVAADAPAHVPADAPQGSGPYPAIMLQEATLPTHTVYRPVDLAGAGKLPIVVWGNGACINVGNMFRYFLTEIASHGFIAIATGPIGTPRAETHRGGYLERGAPAAGSPAAGLAAAKGEAAFPPPPGTTAAQLIAAIDWAVAENRRAGSPYFGRLDTGRIAVMGQSCGGLQATAAARDPRVSALGVWNSGLFPDAEVARKMAAADAPKSLLPTLKLASIYVTGDASDQAFPNADDDFAHIGGPSLRLWREGGGHGGTYGDANGGAYAPVAVAFLKWRLQGDRQAARLFTGPDCGLCTQPAWHLRSKHIDRP